MKITAIILNYQNYQDIRNCILSLEKQILPNNYQLKILVIDNSPDDSDTKKLQLDFSRHEYIFNKQNNGFAKGVNQGINLKLLESDYFLLVNNDAELAPDCLKILLEQSNNQSLAGPVIFYKENSNIIWQGGGFYKKLKMNLSVPDKNKPLTNKKTQLVDFLSGCVLLIPKNVIEKIGLFDEKFFFYGEDLDFCLRAKKAGIKSLYCPAATACHNIKKVKISRTSSFVLKNLAISYFLIIRKHFSNLLLHGLLLFIFIYTPFRFYQTISGGNKWSNITAWLTGGYQGWKIKI